MSNLIGQSLGRYHILEQLGEGGMATVYKAFDTRLERNVAIKIILPSKEKSETFLKRFEREARSLAGLSHPNIVKVLDYGEHKGIPFLVMEYIPGGTLKHQLTSRPIPWQEAARILVPIARALEYAHLQKIIHRDVKPANILLTHSGEPMLSDFGIAKILESEETIDLTGTGVGLGTPEYMAPEQGLGEGVDHRADIYALGVILYEMVTGRKPYRADTPMAVLLKKATEPLPRPRNFVRDLPEAVEQVLFKALAKKPEDRYQSMGDFASALERLAHGAQLSGEPEPRKEKPAPSQPSPINWKPVALGLLAVIALAGVVWIASFLIGKIPAAVKPTETPMLTLTSTTIPTLSITSTTTPTNPHLPTVTMTSTPSLGIGSTWMRPADGMVMVYVPEGNFTMGSNNGSSDEQPVHTVYLDVYWIDRTEVTNAMYALCVSTGSCQPPGNSSSFTRSNYYGNSQYADYPVINMEWNDTNAYCAWAEARLPTEAEWEKAARGTDGRTYPWGNEWDVQTTLRLNFSDKNDPTGASDTVADDGYSDTAPVGNYPNGSSPYGTLDMAGNVWEWVSDWYGENYYENSPSSNPTGPASGQSHVLRGGSWYVSEKTARSTNRYKFDPERTFNVIGFRCARSK